jgi:hypothetical protein
VLIQIMVRDRLYYREGKPLTVFAYPAEAGSRVIGKKCFSFLAVLGRHCLQSRGN